MYYIDHQIANPICQLFGSFVEQIPGFDDHPLPKNGWHEDIDKLTIQKETIAYNLLFARAIQANSRGAVGAFASLLGATVSAKPVRATRKSTSGVTKAVPAQSTLDSMFSARMQVDAINETVKKAKKKIEEEKPKSTRKPKLDT
jgi:hypothetical protein